MNDMIGSPEGRKFEARNRLKDAVTRGPFLAARGLLEKSRDLCQLSLQEAEESGEEGWIKVEQARLEKAEVRLQEFDSKQGAEYERAKRESEENLSALDKPEFQE